MTIFVDVTGSGPNLTLRLIEHAAHAPFLSHRDIFLDRVFAFLAK